MSTEKRTGRPRLTLARKGRTGRTGINGGDGPRQPPANPPPVDPLADVVRSLDPFSLDTIAASLSLTLEDFMKDLPRYYGDHKEIERVFKYWLRLPMKQRESATFKSVCAATHFPERDIYKVLSLYVWDYQHSAAYRLVAMNRENLVARSIANALNDPKERARWLESLGHFAVPRAAQMLPLSINVSASAHAGAVAAADAESGGLPSFAADINDAAEDIRAIVPARRELTEGSAALDMPAFLAYDKPKVAVDDHRDER